MFWKNVSRKVYREGTSVPFESCWLLHTDVPTLLLTPLAPTMRIQSIQQGLIIAVVLSSIWGFYTTRNRNLHQLRAVGASRNEEDLVVVSNAGDLYIYVSIAYFKYDILHQHTL